MSAIVSSWFDLLARLVLRHKLVTAVSFTLLCVGIGAGAALLEVDFSARAFFGGDDDGLARLDAHQARWGADDAIMLVTAVVSEGSLLEQRRLEELQKLARAIEGVQGVKRTVGLHNVFLPRREGGALAFRSVKDALQAAHDRGEQPVLQYRAEVLHDAMIVPTALSADGKATGIAVELSVPADDIAAVRPVVLAIEALIAERQGQQELALGVAGVPVVRAKMLGLILEDQVTFVPIAFAIMGLLLLLLYRRFHGVLLPLLVAGIPAALVMGVMGYAGEPIGVINQVYFTLLPVIAVSGGIHLLSRYYEEANRGGAHHATLLPLDREAAITRAVRYVGGACLFSYVTTMVGLLTLQTSSMPILRSFGMYSATGVAFAWLTLVVLVPLILSVTRGRVLDPEQERRQARVNALLSRCADLSLRFPKSCVAVALVVVAGSLWLGSFVVVDNSVSGMLREDHPATIAGKVVDDQLLGLISLEIALQGEPGAFDQPGVVKATAALEEQLRALPDVRVVQGPGSFIRRSGYALTGERTLPASRELLAQLAFLQDGSGFYDAVLSEDRSGARIVVRTADLGGRRFAALEGQVKAASARFRELPVVAAAQVSTLVTGTASLQYGGVNRLAEDLRVSLTSAWVIILGVFLLLFRSARIALIAVLPNALPLIAGYGLVGLLGWPLEPGPAVIFTVALGLAVDDTIHMLSRTAERHRSGAGLEDSIRYALIHTGRPVVMTSVILAAGFGVNMLSAFPNNARVGGLGAFIIVVALLADLFVLPALLKLFGNGAFRVTDHDEDVSD